MMSLLQPRSSLPSLWINQGWHHSWKKGGNMLKPSCPAERAELPHTEVLQRLNWLNTNDSSCAVIEFLIACSTSSALPRWHNSVLQYGVRSGARRLRVGMIAWACGCSSDIQLGILWRSCDCRHTEFISLHSLGCELPDCWVSSPTRIRHGSCSSLIYAC